MSENIDKIRQWSQEFTAGLASLPNDWDVRLALLELDERLKRVEAELERQHELRLEKRERNP